MRRIQYFLWPVCALLAGGVVSAPVAAQEPALTWTHQDSRLEWVPCPEFMPKGCAIAVLHGDPAKPNVDIFFKVPAGSSIAPHTHTSAERMVLVSGELRVNYEGQEAAVLKPGTYAFGPPGRPHSAQCAKGDPCVLFIAFESPLDAMPVEAAKK